MIPTAQTLADQIPDDVFFTVAAIRDALPLADTVDIAQAASKSSGLIVSEAWVVAVLDGLREADREMARESIVRPLEHPTSDKIAISDRK